MRAISSDAVGDALDLEVYGGFVELRPRTRRPRSRSSRPSCPTSTTGPHFFYGLQWWFFGVLAVGGFGYLAWDERRTARGASDGRAARSE